MLGNSKQSYHSVLQDQCLPHHHPQKTHIPRSKHKVVDGMWTLKMTTKPAHLTTPTICENAQRTCAALLLNSSFLRDRAEPVLIFLAGIHWGGRGLWSLQFPPSEQLLVAVICLDFPTRSEEGMGAAGMWRARGRPRTSSSFPLASMASHWTRRSLPASPGLPVSSLLTETSIICSQ